MKNQNELLKVPRRLVRAGISNALMTAIVSIAIAFTDFSLGGGYALLGVFFLFSSYLAVSELFAFREILKQTAEPEQQEKKD